mmetsp:Transcript_22015/g.3654  ORF Transcript_22015/g.3654 Transcript_22015/m.3654 type:complete len:81 (-) Transcript_22015:105-347(-)
MTRYNFYLHFFISCLYSIALYLRIKNLVPPSLYSDHIYYIITHFPIITLENNVEEATDAFNIDEINAFNSTINQYISWFI